MGLWDDWTGATDRALLRSILTELQQLNSNTEDLMGLIEDISAKLDATQASLAAIAADEAGLKQPIADLIAAGTGATTEQLQQLLAKAQANADAAAAIDTSTP